MPIKDSRIPLKNPWLAALLAFLVPGLGHIYQGRFFKGTIYAVCILGTFLMGMCMGDGKVVYFSQDDAAKDARVKRKTRVIGYFAQFGVGMFSVPAYLQSQRYYNPENVGQSTLDDDLDASFEGFFVRRNANNRLRQEALKGEISLSPVAGEFGPVVKGKFVGKNEAGESVELDLSEPFELDKPIDSSGGRLLVCEVVLGGERDLTSVGRIEGVVPRPLIDRFAVPISKHDLEELNGRLGKLYELALVYTWIAGLLNILAIWDAFEGPAYGYGDEAESSQPAVVQSQATASGQPVGSVGAPAGDPKSIPKSATEANSEVKEVRST